MKINRRAFLGTAVMTAGVAQTATAERLLGMAEPLVAPTAGLAAPVAAVAAAPAAPSALAALVPMVASMALPLEAVRIVEVLPLHLGALPIILEHEGDRFQVDVLRREADDDAGVARSEHLSVFVRNGGDGSVETGRTRELAARALLIALENAGTASDLSDALLTHRERARRHPDGAFAALNATLPEAVSA